MRCNQLTHLAARAICPDLRVQAALGIRPRTKRLIGALIVAAVLLPHLASAQPAPPPVPAAATGDHIDPAAATAAYLATMPADRKAKSDAYFEGGYWITLWDFLITAAIYLGLLHLGASAGLRDRIDRLVRWRWVQVALYAAAFVVVVNVVSLPWSIYTGFVREHQYGLSTQTFGAWMGDAVKGLAVGLITFPLGAMALYAVLRRTGRRWPLWGALVAIGLLVFFVAIAPVYVAPLFNTYTPLKESPTRDDILRMAHANGIMATDVYQVDASRQSTRVSANVSGMFGTERITLNDNLLARASPGAIDAVLGHEMGHYVLHHVYKMLLSFGIVVLVGFAVSGWAFDRLASRYRARWRVGDVADPAGLPLLALLLTTYLFLLTPVINTIVRTNEFEADVFGLNAARQPDGFAEAALLLSDYRKMNPTPLEEFLFYDHPSGRTRIFTAMQWKAYSRTTNAGVTAGAR